MRKLLIADHPLFYGRRIAAGEEFSATEPHARVWIGLRKAHLKVEDAPVAIPAVQTRTLEAEPPPPAGSTAVPAAGTRRRRTYRRRDVKPGETK